MQKFDKAKNQGFRLPRVANCGKVNTGQKLMAGRSYLFRPILVLTFHLLHGHKTCLGEGIYGSPHFSGISVCSQIREDLRRFLSASVDSHLPPAQNNHAKVAYLGEE